MRGYALAVALLLWLTGCCPRVEQPHQRLPAAPLAAVERQSAEGLRRWLLHGDMWPDVRRFESSGYGRSVLLTLFPGGHYVLNMSGEECGLGRWRVTDDGVLMLQAIEQSQGVDAAQLTQFQIYRTSDEAATPVLIPLSGWGLPKLVAGSRRASRPASQAPASPTTYTTTQRASR
jgi:hypothetical protein